jgi:hypothetical protein
MRVLKLKKDPKVFQATVDGLKPYEIRLDDRGYEVGDVLNVLETQYTGEEMKEGAPLIYTGREYTVEVTYILRGYGLHKDWVIMSFKEVGA